MYNIYIIIDKYIIYILNMILPKGNTTYRIAKISFKKGDHGKNSFERRVYESVDNNSLPILAIIRKRFLAIMGQECSQYDIVWSIFSTIA